MSLLLRLLTPCNLINNEVGRKCFGSIDAQTYRDLFFNKYLSEPGYSECKLLAFEILTIYLLENPSLTEDPFFKSQESKEKYAKWRRITYPDPIQGTCFLSNNQ